MMMLTSSDIPSEIVREFQLSDPHLAAETAIARVWRVTYLDAPAALKIYHDQTLSGEGPGFELLRALDGCGAVRVLAHKGIAVLMDWLDGPSLGDLARAGQDEEANVHLVDVACAIHEFKGPLIGLTPLYDWCADLFSIRFAPECSSQFRHDMQRAQNIARRLFASAEQIGPLHGDLHHDNIKLGPDGWRAFDAKGLVGEKTYELANAFRNPSGIGAWQRDPRRFHACADLWAERFDVDRIRLMRWAAVKVALSIVWRSGPIVIDDKEADLLAMMLAQLPET